MNLLRFQPSESATLRHPPDLLPLLYQLEQTYGWSTGMHAVAQAILARLRLPDGPILELGCGAGAFLAALASRYPLHAAYGTDIHPLALTYARQWLPSPPKLARADLQTLPFLAETFGLVVALDAIDQRGVAVMPALRESWRVLRPQGLLLLRVSAYPWLASMHDTAFHTERRFRRQELIDMLRAAGFVTLHTTYANTLLAPALIPIRLLQRWGLFAFQKAYYTAATANHLLASLLQIEARWLRKHNFCFGVSLYALAAKVEPTSPLLKKDCHDRRTARLYRFTHL